MFFESAHQTLPVSYASMEYGSRSNAAFFIFTLNFFFFVFFILFLADFWPAFALPVIAINKCDDAEDDDDAAEVKLCFFRLFTKGKRVCWWCGTSSQYVS